MVSPERQAEIRQIINDTPEWAPSWIEHIESELTELEGDNNRLRKRIHEVQCNADKKNGKLVKTGNQLMWFIDWSFRNDKQHQVYVKLNKKWQDAQAVITKPHANQDQKALDVAMDTLSLIDSEYECRCENEKEQPMCETHVAGKALARIKEIRAKANQDAKEEGNGPS